MYELYHGDLTPRTRTWNTGSFRFAGNYWIFGNQQHLNHFDPLLGYGWLLGDWCPHGKVATSMTDEGVKPDQSARLSKTMHTNTVRPVTNPDDYCDFEVQVTNGRYLVIARVGDLYTKTWQRVEIEGVDAGTYALNRKVQTTKEMRVPVRDGRLTLRVHLKNDPVPAGLQELHFSIIGKENY
jgi:hypothetical protein